MAQEEVGFEAFADTKLRTSFEDFADSQVKVQPVEVPTEPIEPRQKPAWHEKYTSLIKPLVGGFYGSASNTFAAMDKAADYISKQTGLDKGGIFGDLSAEYQARAEKLKAGGMRGIPGDVAAGIGGAAWDVPMIMAPGKFGLPIHGGLMGLAEEGVPGAIKGAVQGALVHKTLQGIALLPSKAQPLAFMGFGAATTPGDIEERVTGGLTWAALGISGRKGKVTFNDFISTYPKISEKLTENRARFVIKRLAKDITTKDIEDAGGARAVLDEAAKQARGEAPKLGEREGAFEEFADVAIRQQPPTAELKARQDALSKELTGPKEGPFKLSKEAELKKTQE